MKMKVFMIVFLVCFGWIAVTGAPAKSEPVVLNDDARPALRYEEDVIHWRYESPGAPLTFKEKVTFK